MSKTIFPILLIGAAGFIFYFFVSPAYAEVQVLKEKRAEYEEALSKANELQAKLDALHDQLESFPPEQLKRLESLLPGHVENVRFVLELSNKATAHDMSISNISISEREQNPYRQNPEGDDAFAEVRKVTVGFDTEGDYDSLLNFLRDIEKSLRLVDIDAVSLGEGREGSGADYHYNITVTTYWLNYNK